jgi:heme exporter protein A
MLVRVQPRAHSRMLTADNLQVWRGDRHVLKGVGFRLSPGELLHVSGPNGTGKTTLLRVACGLGLPEEGEIAWRGKSIASLGSEYFDDVGYVAHDAGLKGDLTARENVGYIAALRHSVTRAQIETALATLEVEDCAELPARALSAGQRRRVALARLLLSGAPLWILDEPLTNLDASGTAVVLDLLARHLESGGLALVATHGDLGLPRGRVARLELE